METADAIREIRRLCGDNYDAIAVLKALLQVIDGRLTKVETGLAYLDNGLVVRNEVTPEYRNVPNTIIGLD